MKLLSYYLQLLSDFCEGKRPLPQGIGLSETDPTKRALELQKQISAIGIADFLRTCAKEDGMELSEEELASFNLENLQSAFSDVPAEEPEEAEPVRSEIRDIYEVFLDSILLDDALLHYLIDVLKRGAQDEFAKLSHAAARTILDMNDFLAWLGNKQLIAPEPEQLCAQIMDACLSRLAEESNMELLAALLSGDETTFKLFRCEAPELVHLPDASYEWFCTNYLDQYYPVRFVMRYNGVVFPEA